MTQLLLLRKEQDSRTKNKKQTKKKERNLVCKMMKVNKVLVQYREKYVRNNGVGVCVCVCVKMKMMMYRWSTFLQKKEFQTLICFLQTIENAREDWNSSDDSLYDRNFLSLSCTSLLFVLGTHYTPNISC